MQIGQNAYNTALNSYLSKNFVWPATAHLKAAASHRSTLGRKPPKRAYILSVATSGA